VPHVDVAAHLLSICSTSLPYFLLCTAAAVEKRKYLPLVPPRIRNVERNGLGDDGTYLWVSKQAGYIKAHWSPSNGWERCAFSRCPNAELVPKFGPSSLLGVIVAH
jgi:hypothetical protein